MQRVCRCHTNSEDVNNYRLVALLSILSKVLAQEMLVLYVSDSLSNEIQ